MRFGKWLTGDVLRRKFNWLNKTVSAENERTRWNHTIFNVVGPWQIVVIMDTVGTVVSILPMR